MAAVDDFLGAANGDVPGPYSWLSTDKPVQSGAVSQASVPPALVTGVENVRADDAAMSAAPDNPKDAREVVERGVVNVANPPSATSSPPDAPDSTPEKRRLSYVEMYEMMNPDKPETDEQRAKREKRERSQAALAAVGDAISALSNIWFTSRYAPNAYNAAKGMTASTKERWEKMRQQREANRSAYYDGYLRARAMDDAAEKDERKWRYTVDSDERNWQHTIEREQKQDEYRDAKEFRDEQKAERDELMFQARYALQLGKLTEQGYRNSIMEIKAGTLQDLTEAQIRRLNRVGSGSGSGGSAKPGKIPWYDKDGNLHYAHTFEEARQNSLLNDTWEEGTQTSVSVKSSPDALGRTKETKTTTTKPARGHSKKPSGNGNKWNNTSKIQW